MADPVSIGINIALQAAVSYAIYLLTPEQVNEGPRVDDRQITTSTYGNEIPLSFGTVIVGGNVIWGQDLEEVKNVTTPGKGGPKIKDITYQYFATFAVALSRRQVQSILRIYADGKLIYDVEAQESPEQRDAREEAFGWDGTPTPEEYTALAQTTDEGGNPTVNPALIDGAEVDIMEDLDFNFYPGSETQLPDPIIEAAEGVGNTPAYRGICYVVFNRLPLENFGNRIPQLRFVISHSTTALGKPKVNYEITTDTMTGNMAVHWDPVYRLAISRHWDNGSLGVDADDHKFAVIDPVTGEKILEKTAAQLVRTFDDVNGNERVASVDINSRLFIGGPGGPYFGTVNTAGDVKVTLISKTTLNIVDMTYQHPGSTKDWTIEEYDPDASGVERIFADFRGAATFVHVKGEQLDEYFIIGGPEPNTTHGGFGFGILACTESQFFFIYGTGPNGAFLPASPTLDNTWEGIIACLQLQQRTGATDYLVVMERFDGTGFDFNVGRLGSGGGYEIPNDNLFLFPTTRVSTGLNLIYDQVRDYLMIDFDVDGTTECWFLDSANQFEGKFLVWRLESRPWQARHVPSVHAMGSETLTNNLVFRRSTTDAFFVNIEDGSWTTEGMELADFPSGDTTVLSGPNFAGFYDGVGQLYLTPGTSYKFVEPIVRSAESLKTVVDYLTTLTKLNAADVVTTDLATIPVRGYAIASQMSVRTSLEPLMTAYNAYGVEKDGLLQFALNDGLVDRVVGVDDYIEDPDQTTFEETRGQESETPRALFIKCRSPDNDDKALVQGARRVSFPTTTMGSVGEKTLELPLYLTAEEAINLAARILFESWVQRERFKFRLPQRYVDILPNDILRIVTEGRTENMRLDQLTIGQSLKLEVEGVVVDDQVYVNDKQGVYPVFPQGYTGALDTANKTKFVTGIFIDAPMARDQDLGGRDNGLMYFVAAKKVPSSKNFAGATLSVSFNNTDFSARTGTLVEMAWGVCQSNPPDIPSVDWFGVQEASITITPLARADEFVSVTQDNMIQKDLNRALIMRPDGTPEYINFRDVYENSDGSLTLVGLLRGRRGTNSDATGYASVKGDIYVVLLSEDWVSGYFENIAYNDQVMSYRVLSNIITDQVFDTKTQTIQHRALMPYEPAAVTMTFDNSQSEDERIISWTRRTRKGGFLRDYTASPPLNEDSESYEVDILDGSGGNVVRTLTSTTTSVKYTAAQADADFGTDFPNPLYVRVYQISAQVGRGFSSERALTET